MPAEGWTNLGCDCCGGGGSGSGSGDGGPIVPLDPRCTNLPCATAFMRRFFAVDFGTDSNPCGLADPCPTLMGPWVLDAWRQTTPCPTPEFTDAISCAWKRDNDYVSGENPYSCSTVTVNLLNCEVVSSWTLTYTGPAVDVAFPVDGWYLYSGSSGGAIGRIIYYSDNFDCLSGGSFDLILNTVVQCSFPTTYADFPATVNAVPASGPL